VGRIDGRLRRLEQAYGKPCPECGWDGRDESLDWEIVWGTKSGNIPTTDNPDDWLPVEPRWCATCGCPEVLVITWGDEPEETEGVSNG
jgi:hypothetical protein